MKYEIYCDESCIEALFDTKAHAFASIGGIWIPSDHRTILKEEISSIKAKYGFLGEMKWNKVTPKSVQMYYDLIDLFFRVYQVRFRAICMESAKIDNGTFNQGSGELGFYKFYYQLIQHWLVPGESYTLFLDHKINRSKSRVAELRHFLQQTSNAKIESAQALPSNESALIQLADVLVGAVSSSFNGELKVGSAKSLICTKIEEYLGHPIQRTGVNEQKFNVFNINLKQSW